MVSGHLAPIDTNQRAFLLSQEKLFSIFAVKCNVILGWHTKFEPDTQRNREDMAVILIQENRKNDLVLIITPEKQDKTLESSKHWSVDSTPARNEVIMKRTYPVKSVKCDKICSNY